MKRKILAIALSLALLTSLFVFAAPVSAGNPSSMEFLITLGARTGIENDNAQIKWHGPEIEVTLPYDSTPDTRLLDGHLKVNCLIDPQGEKVQYIYECSGTFSEGEAILDYERINDNFKTIRTVINAEWELTFNNAEWEGTILMNRIVKYDIVGWKNASGYSVNRVAVEATWNVIRGTGDFNGFHYVQHDISMAGSMTIAGSCFFTGK